MYVEFQNAPPLELMHLAAAGNTVVGDRYGPFFCLDFLNVFFIFLVRAGCKKVRAAPMPRRGGVFWVCIPPMLTTLCIVNVAAGASVGEALPFFWPCCCPASLLCSNVLWSDGPRPGPSPHTDIHMCLYGPWDVICAWSGLSHWPRRSPACWGEK